MHTRTSYSLDDSSAIFGDQPFHDQTVTLLRSVRDHDFETLSALCDDDFGIVDIDVDGTAHPVRDRKEWEQWFTNLFATMTGMGAATDSFIVDYQARAEGSLGFGALEFIQTLTAGPHVATFECVATIIWKRTPEGWREARWHASIISSDVPAELQPAA